MVPEYKTVGIVQQSNANLKCLAHWWIRNFKASFNSIARQNVQASDMDSPPLGTTERRPSLVQRCARAMLRAFGWRSVLVAPPAPKGIIVVYPHTSNWDFIIGVLYKIGAGLPAR